MTMLKSFTLTAALFALGILLGSLFTPVGVDWNKELIDPEADVPVPQKSRPESRSQSFRFG